MLCCCCLTAVHLNQRKNLKLRASGLKRNLLGSPHPSSHLPIHLLQTNLSLPTASPSALVFVYSRLFRFPHSSHSFCTCQLFKTIISTSPGDSHHNIPAPKPFPALRTSCAATACSTSQILYPDKVIVLC